MTDPSKTGSDWTGEELDAIVEDYFAMFALDAAGQPFVKAHRAKALDEQIRRGHKSIEFKHMNISAVAAELGLPHVRGYRPMANYQAAIFDAIDRHLAAHPEVLADTSFLPVAASRWGGGASPLGDVTEGATGSFPGVAEPATHFNGGEGGTAFHPK